MMKKIQNCRKRLLRFKLPIVKIESATLDEIGEVFTRVNSLGMKVTSADRAIALMGKLDVHAIADQLRQKFREANFELGSVDPILMGFNLVTEELQPEGDPPKLERMARRWSKKIENDESSRKEFQTIWHRYQDAACEQSNISGSAFQSTMRVSCHQSTCCPPRGFLLSSSLSSQRAPG